MNFIGPTNTRIDQSSSNVNTPKFTQANKLELTTARCMLTFMKTNNCKMTSLALSIILSLFTTWQESGAAEEQSQLSALNSKFREYYAAARSHEIEASTPLILCYADRLVLLNGSQREEVANIKDRYTTFKTVAHIPLALYCILYKEPIIEKSRQKLDDFKSLIEKARGELKDHDLSVKELERQYKMIDSCLTFIDKALAQKELTAKELQEFTRSLRSDILQNAYLAVSSQLAVIDQTVGNWRQKLGKDFDKIKIVIVGGHMPRQGNSNFQYFCRLLKEKEEGNRIIYMEGLNSDTDALNLLGTHILDEGVAVSFFSDKWRMHRDLLSDGAAQYLKEHPPSR